MADEPSDEALMRILQFDAEELERNRQGMLSLQQRLRLFSQIDQPLLALVLLAPLGIVIQLREPQSVQSVVNILVLIALVVIVATFSRKSIRLLLDIVTGQVSEASGTITVRIYRFDRRTFAGMLGTQYANGTIGSESFIVPVALAESFQGKSLRVFYTPRYRQAVSGHILP